MKYRMHPKDLFFVIPTHRLRDVGETVQQYDEHFWRNGHTVRMIVFDDSSPDNQAKYYSHSSGPAPTTTFTMSVQKKRSSSWPT